MAKYFDEVHVHADYGGDDTSDVRSVPSLVDHLTARLPATDPAHFAEVSGGGGHPFDYLYRFMGFEHVLAYGQGNDTRDVTDDTAAWLVRYGWGGS